MFSKVFLCLAAFSLTFSQVNKTDYFLRNCFLFSCLTLTESDKHLKMYLIAPLAFWGMFVQITVSMCTIQNHCTQTCAVRAGQWKMVPSHLAGVHAVRWGAPHPGPPRLPHLTAPTSVLAPPSQVRLIFASDRCPLTGKSRWEVRHLKMNVYKSKKKKKCYGIWKLTWSALYLHSFWLPAEGNSCVCKKKSKFMKKWKNSLISHFWHNQTLFLW